MRTLIGAIVILAFAATTGVRAQEKEKDKDKIDLKKLMGKWEPKEGKVLIEFADKGKLVLSVDANGKGQKFEGTYKLDGNRLEIDILIDKQQKETLTVKKLTDDELVTTDSKGKEETLKRKK
jgi:uncharacterized protein (TIGR03066 family)